MLLLVSEVQDATAIRLVNEDEAAGGILGREYNPTL